MKAYVCSIGEKTTELCCEQLKKFGFEVILMNKKEAWYDKYISFLKTANEDCIRVDADVIVNENIKLAKKPNDPEYMMKQYRVYDLYQNNLHDGQPVFYSKKGLEFLRNNLSRIGRIRPETDAWRIPEMNLSTFTITNWVVGMHGFFQDTATLDRAERNKIIRGQVSKYDFDLARKLQAL